jgi:hypothetical protein
MRRRRRRRRRASVLNPTSVGFSKEVKYIHILIATYVSD